MNKTLLSLIPNELKHLSGSVFYTGPKAFSQKKVLYILGLNPGGSPLKKDHQTINYHTEKLLRQKEGWSEYRDEKWDNKAPGSAPLQRRVLHLLAQLELNPSEIPASNVVFVRTRRAIHIKKDFFRLASLCWPFHQYVIESQNIQNILCFGKMAGGFVRTKLNAHELIGEFVEDNNRKWITKIYSNIHRVSVIVATHPSIADWTSSETDPSNLIKKVLNFN
jgi:hypothetical protein